MAARWFPRIATDAGHFDPRETAIDEVSRSDRSALALRFPDATESRGAASGI